MPLYLWEVFHCPPPVQVSVAANRSQLLCHAVTGAQQFVCVLSYVLLPGSKASCAWVSAAPYCRAFSWNAAAAFNPPEEQEYLCRTPACVPQLALVSLLASICMAFIWHCLKWHWRHVPSAFFLPFSCARQRFVLSACPQPWDQLSWRQNHENYRLCPSSADCLRHIISQGWRSFSPQAFAVTLNLYGNQSIDI